MPVGFVIGDRILTASSGDTHPHWVAGYGTVGSYWVLAASAIGQSHLAASASRDDAVVVRTAGPWLAVGVADGVGSVPLSRYGASYVADSLASRLVQPFTPPLGLDPVRGRSGTPGSEPHPFPPLSSGGHGDQAPREAGFVGSGSLTWSPSISSAEDADGETGVPSEPGGDPENVDTDDATPGPAAQSDEEALMVPLQTDQDNGMEEVVLGAFRGAHASLAHYAAALKLDPSDLSCTALGLLMNVESRSISVGQVGDGAFFQVLDDGAVSPLFNPQSNHDLQSTHVLSSAGWEEHFATRTLQPDRASLRAVLVTTDGISADLLYAPPATMHSWANKLCDHILGMPSPAVAAERIVHEIATYSYQGSVDDRTLVVILRR